MGFVKLSDDLKNWAWIDDPKTVYVYVRLLLGATWGDFDYRNIHLKRGQIAISQREFAKECKITYQELRTILNRLISTQKITQSTTQKLSIITLVEYDCETQSATQSLTRNQRDSNAIITQCQRNNNAASLYITNKQNNKQSNNALAREGGVLSENFEIFWNAYPKKTAKQQAFKAFQKLNPDEDLMSEIIAALERQKKSVQWTKNNGQFIPYPTTWLNGRRWEDEETEVQSGTGSEKYQMPTTKEEWLKDFAGYE